VPVTAGFRPADDRGPVGVAVALVNLATRSVEPGLAAVSHRAESQFCSRRRRFDGGHIRAPHPLFLRNCLPTAAAVTMLTSHVVVLLANWSSTAQDSVADTHLATWP
jgi:hypothetical protein